MASYEATMLKLEQMAQANTAKQMDWQERMSKTSHQMEVADLKAAGLNPVLSSNQGANAYSTSVDSAVNGIASMASAREGANASRFAARQAAAATKAAAASQLAAARESAAAARYAADRNYAAKIYEVEHSKSGSVAGIADNWIKATQNDNTGVLKSLNKSYKDMTKDPGKFLKNPNNTKISNVFDLNSAGRNIIQKTLRNIGISNTLPNQQIVFAATYQGDKKAQTILQSWVSAFNRKTNSAVRKWNRAGSGIW